MQDSLPQDDTAWTGAGDTGPGQAAFRDRAPEEGAGAPPQDRGVSEPDAGRDSDAAADQAAVLAAMAAADPEAARALQAAWGADLATNLDLARKAVGAFASPELARALDDSGLGDHPALIRVAAEVGRLLEGAAPAGSGPAPDLDAAALESLEAEIDQLHALQFARPQEYRSERTQRALARLYARRYGGGRAAGALGPRP